MGLVLETRWNIPLGCAALLRDFSAENEPMVYPKLGVLQMMRVNPLAF